MFITKIYLLALLGAQKDQKTDRHLKINAAREDKEEWSFECEWQLGGLQWIFFTSLCFLITMSTAFLTFISTHEAFFCRRDIAV